MDRAMVNREVKSTVVRAMASTAMQFRVLAAFMDWRPKCRTQALLDTRIMSLSPPAGNLSILNADGPVGHLGNLLIVGDHHNGLAEGLAGNL